MNPTKEETDRTLAQIQAETDQVFFRDLGNHNRAIARDRIAERRSRLNVDDIIETRITGQRSYFPADADTKRRLKHLGEIDYPRRISIPWRLIALVSAILLLSYAIARSI